MSSPFYRELKVQSPMLTGNDVLIAQTLISRDAAVGANFVVDGVYGSDSETACKSFQMANKLEATGVVDESTSQALLDLHSADGYKDSGFTAASMGYLYKVRNNLMSITDIFWLTRGYFPNSYW
jgi:peptidoglycan hydrolase-like protein with peptidoglycan-binding domain